MIKVTQKELKTLINISKTEVFKISDDGTNWEYKVVGKRMSNPAVTNSQILKSLNDISKQIKDLDVKVSEIQKDVEMLKSFHIEDIKNYKNKV